jgi:hypothetical protein
MTKDEPPARAGLRWRLDPIRVAAPRWPWVALAAVLMGCGASQRPMRRAAPAVLEDPSRVRDWDGLVRPDALYLLAAFVAASGDPSSERCPSVVRTGNEARIRGDCIDAAGDAWSGRARWVRSEDGAVDMHLRQFGTAKSRVDGRLHVDDEPMRASLDVYVVLDEPTSPWPAGPSWKRVAIACA